MSLESSTREAFVGRRQRLRALLSRAQLSCAIIASGLPQPRNFPHNLYPFRASSHFLYLLGVPLEGALLSIGPDHEALYAEPPDAEASLWSGPQPSLDELADQLGLEVRPVDSLEIPVGAACVPPVDALTTLWLGDLLGRPLEPAHGEPQTSQDALLADALIELRLRHDPAALTQLRLAARVTQAAHQSGMRITRQCHREFELCAAMEAEIRRQGLNLAYQSIVTCHGEVLHNESHENEIAPHDLVLADVGAETREGWAADVTRTWPARGRFSTTQRELYEVVLAAQEAAIGCVAPGVRFMEVHLQAQRAMASGLVDLGILRGSVDDLVQSGATAIFFPHGVGHLLGLDVHDLEDLGDRAGYTEGRQRSQHPGTRFLRLDRELESQMVVTVEPGFYRIERLLEAASRDLEVNRFIDFRRLASFNDVRGIRIEDDVLVTEGGCEVLTAGAPKQPDDVELACS